MAPATDANRGATKNDQARLERLAAFAPILRDPKTIFGKWHPDGFGWFELSAVGDKFYEAVSANWFIANFDRPMWEESAEGQSLIRDRETMGSSTSDAYAICNVSFAVTSAQLRGWLAD